MVSFRSHVLPRVEIVTPRPSPARRDQTDKYRRLTKGDGHLHHRRPRAQDALRGLGKGRDGRFRHPPGHHPPTRHRADEAPQPMRPLPEMPRRRALRGLPVQGRGVLRPGRRKLHNRPPGPSFGDHTDHGPLLPDQGADGRGGADAGAADP